MEHPVRRRMDTSKRVFQVDGVDASERPCLRKKLSRDAMMALFEAMPPTVTGIEACGPGHHWVRTLPEVDLPEWVNFSRAIRCVAAEALPHAWIPGQDRRAA